MALHIYRGLFEFETIWGTLEKTLELNNLMLEKALELGFKRFNLNLFRLVHRHKTQDDKITLYTKRNSK